MRDRDELAAALEVRDRIKYDLSTPEREEILSTGDLIVEVMFCKTDFEDNNGSFPNQSLFLTPGHPRITVFPHGAHLYDQTLFKKQNKTYSQLHSTAN